MRKRVIEQESARSDVILSIFLSIFDASMVILALVVVVNVREFLSVIRPFHHSLNYYLEFWYLSLLWPIAFASLGLYRGLWLPGDQQLRRIAWGSTLATSALVALTFISQQGEDYSRAILFGLWGSSIFFVSSSRMVWKIIFTKMDFGGRPTVLLGSREGCEFVLRHLSEQRPRSYRIVAIFLNEHDLVGAEICGVPVNGLHDLASSWAKKHNVESALFSQIGLDPAQSRDVLDQVGISFRHFSVIPQIPPINSYDVSIDDVSGILCLHWENSLGNVWRRRGKRLVDLCITVVLSPFVLLIGILLSLLIILDSGLPIFFSQERRGRGGKNFQALKFRTMIPNAEQVLEDMLEEDSKTKEEWDRQQKLEHDPRITRVGQVLRRFSLDELPQFINILRGEMSLVGPRPILDSQVEAYGNKMALYELVRPGLTGLWQVSGRASTTFKRRVDFDEYYIRHWSIWLDFIIIARTFLVLLSGKGAY